MIEIQDIENSSKEDIINLLLDEKFQPFEIYVPKETVLFSSSDEDIAHDYAVLAYAGQKLKEASDSFEYGYISPSEHSSVCFRILAKNIERLASEIFDISLWYFNDFLEDDFYLDEVYQFIEDVGNSKIKPACPDFIEDHVAYKG